MATVEELEAAIARAESDNNEDAANYLRKQLKQATEETLSETALQTEALIDSYEGVGTETFEGVLSGLLNASEGAYSVYASVVDPEDSDKKIKNYAETTDKIRNYLSIDPQGVAGTVGEVGGQYVIPSLAAIISTGGASLPVQLAALGATDFIVANDDYTGVANFFDNAPEVLKQQSLDGLSGKEASDTRLKNKLKAAGEGIGFGIVGPYIIKGASAVGGKTISAIGGVPIVAPVARTIQAGADKISSGFGKLEEKRRIGEDLGLFKNTLVDALSVFRYRGILPEEVSDERLLIGGRSQKDITRAEKSAAELENNIDKVFKRGAQIMVNGTRMDREGFLTKVEDVLTAPNAQQAEEILEVLPSSLKTPLKKMRTHLDEVRPLVLGSSFLKRNDYLNPETEELLSEVIGRNVGEYLRRRYRIFEDVNYQPSAEVLETGLRGFMADRSATAKQLQEIADNPLNDLSRADVGLSPDGDLLGDVTREMAELARDNFLKKNALKKRSIASKLTPSRIASERIAPGMFIERVNLPDYQKALLGEVKNPLVSYVATMADISEFLAVDKFQGKLVDLAQNNPLFSRFIKDTRNMTPDQIKVLTKDDGYVVLGKKLDDPTADLGPSEALSEWGALNGFAVPMRVYKDLTRTVLGDMGVIGNGIRATYSGFLRGKGAVQYGKTVLSPITQVRNVTSASLFALAQGNIGSGASLGESLRIVMNGYKKLPDDVQVAKFNRAQELGITGTQTQVEEIKALLKKGFDPDVSTINGVQVGRKFGSKFGDTGVGGALMGFGKTAQNFYTGGDDLWKLYNWTFEQNKIKKALDNLDDVGKVAVLKNVDEEGARRIIADLNDIATWDSALLRQEAIDRMTEEYAANIVRNTVPNYAKVPEFIKSLRKAPVGNFIAFPYEVLRTGVNTIATGVTELASANPEIQKIGLRRLVGASAAFYGFEESLKKLSELATGVTQEQMEAYKVAAGADYEKYSTLLATGPARADGSPSSYVNMTYTNPYGMLTEILNAATTTIGEGKTLGKTPAQITTDAAQEVLSQVMSPFFEESIFLGVIRDVLDPNSSVPVASQLAQYTGGRAGRTITGAKVYSAEDSPGDKVAKSFQHIVGGLLPGISPFEVRGGELEPKPLLRAAIQKAGLGDELGVDPKNRQGRERGIQEELGRAFTGIPTTPTNLEKSLYYKGQGMLSELRDANNIWTSVTQRENVRAEDLLSAYVSANEAKYRVMNKYKRIFDAYEKLGMSKKKIYGTLKKEGISGADDILNNTFVPVTVSETILGRLARNERLDRLPADEIVQLQNTIAGRSFGQQSLGIQELEESQAQQRLKELSKNYSDYMAGAKRAESEGNLSAAKFLRNKANNLLKSVPEEDRVNIQTTVEPTVDAPPAPAPAPAPPQPTILQQVQDKTRTILGTASNPISALRDLEIFQSTRD